MGILVSLFSAILAAAPHPAADSRPASATPALRRQHVPGTVPLPPPNAAMAALPASPLAVPGAYPPSPLVHRPPSPAPPRSASPSLHHARPASPSAFALRPASPLIHPSSPLANRVSTPSALATSYFPIAEPPPSPPLLASAPPPAAPAREAPPHHPPPPSAPALAGLGLATPVPDEADAMLQPAETFPLGAQDAPLDMWDDEGLTPLEKIYLFSRSEATFHRIYIVHALPSFLDEVTSAEAIEYVLPLINGLAVDDEETVKEALATELVPIISWFLANCRLVEDEQPLPSPSDAYAQHVPAPLFVQAFTPILGTLLLSSNGIVGGPARYAVVDLLARIRQVDETGGPFGNGAFGPDERRMFEEELLHHVVIGMGRLDAPDRDADALSGSGTLALTDTPERSLEFEPAMVPLPQTPSATEAEAGADAHNPYFPVLTSGYYAKPTGPGTASAMSPSPVGASTTFPPSPSSMDIDKATQGAAPRAAEPPPLASTSSSASASTSASTSTSSSSSRSSSTSSSSLSPGQTSLRPSVMSPPSERSTPDLSPSAGGLPFSPDEEEPLSPPTVGVVHTPFPSPGREHEAGDKPQPPYLQVREAEDDWMAPPPPSPRLSHTEVATSRGTSADPFTDPAETDGDKVGGRMEDMQAEGGGSSPHETEGSYTEAGEQAAVGRLSSMSLIAAVTAAGPLSEEIQAAFVQEVERIGRDQIYWVRREASFAVGALAKVVPVEVVQQTLLPLFQSLCQDKMWHVRHAALFGLPYIISRLPPQERRRMALNAVVALAADPSPVVRCGVLEALGETIYTFHDDPRGPPEELLQLFLGREEDRRRWDVRLRPRSAPEGVGVADMARATLGVEGMPAAHHITTPDIVWNAPVGTRADFGRESTVSVVTTEEHPQSFFDDPARPLICAFNYPAVAFTLGGARWGDLREVYGALAQSGDAKVRRTIAASLGEMARIVGPEHARRDLVGVWREALVALEPEVRLKAVECVELLVGALAPAEQVAVLSALTTAWTETLKGWRERQAVARALEGLVRALGPRAGLVGPLLSGALDDDVAAVREAAVAATPLIFRMLATHAGVRRAVLEDIGKLVLSDSYRKRVTFVACQQALVLSEDGAAVLAEDAFWRTLRQLAVDPVVNVRIGVARLVGIICERFFRNAASVPGSVLDLVAQLAGDVSLDVRAFVPIDWRERPGAPPPPRPGVDAFANFSRPPPPPAPAAAQPPAPT